MISRILITDNVHARDKEFASKSNEVTINLAADEDENSSSRATSDQRERKLRKGPLAQNTSSLRIGIRSPRLPVVRMQEVKHLHSSIFLRT